ncbi:hypothetical protein TNCV_2950741 [Trichonephila clavipes]|nr:hypothetical protein TNCV_2950741 [Trichonephila clavipes]
MPVLVPILTPDAGTKLRVRSNSWDGQLDVPTDPIYARLETNLGSGRPREDSLVTPLPCDVKHCFVEKWLREAVA